MASLSSGGHDTSDLGNSMEVIHAVSSTVDIAPWERTVCERLVRNIRHTSEGTARPDSPQETSLHSKTLAEVLDDATLAIRFHARWFSETDIAGLVDATLDATFESTASAAVAATIRLIDAIGTYSYLPSQVLPRIVRFISQAYYNARKSHRTKTLAKQVKTVLIRILISHLGDSTVGELLNIVGCGDESFLSSRAGHAQTAGALMIIFQKLWLKEDVRHDVPRPDMFLLVDALRYVARSGDESLREQIMETLAELLTRETAVAELDAQCSWDLLLDVLKTCIARTPKSPYAGAVVDNLCGRDEHLEGRQLAAVAELAALTERPLTPALSEAVIAKWPPSLAADHWSDDFHDLLHRLARSPLYVEELDTLARRYAAIVGMAPDQHHADTETFVQLFKDCILDPATPKGNAGLLVNVLIDLMLRLQMQHPDHEPTLIFDTICHAAEKCTEAVKFMLRFRSDVEGTIYVEPEPRRSQHANSHSDRAVFIPYLSLQQWERTILSIMEDSADWDIYDCLLKGLPELLANHTLFEPRIQFVRRLSGLLCQQIDETQYNDPPTSTGHTKSYIAARIVRVLTAIITYRRQLSKQELLEAASCFVKTAGSRDYVVSNACIYALTICCYEIPDLMSSYMDDVIDKMSKMVTQRFVAIHVLEFLAGLSRLPDLVRNFKRHDYKKIFGVCGSYLQSIRVTGVRNERHMPTSDQDSKASIDELDALPDYVYALAHHVMIFWYLVLKPEDRPELQQYIMRCLRYSTVEGDYVVEDQGLVTIDIIDRVNAGDYRDDTHEPFTAVDGRLVKRQVMAGVVMISTETSLRTGSSIITIRRPSGTTLHLIQGTQDRSPGPAVCVGITTDTSADDYITVVADDPAGRTYGRVSIPRPDSVLGSPRILNLPNDNESLASAVRIFDRTSALDSHKAGVIYVGERQKTEEEILRNHMGSPDYVQFVEGLGTLTRLKGAKFNSQGLDREGDMDGKHAVVWHNEVTELVFHVTTLMPNNDDALLNTSNKKRHIGNDFVNIVFNNSGSAFAFDTFPSDFNTVYIVITPSARTTFLQTRQHSPATTAATASPSTTDGPTPDTPHPPSFYRVQILTRPEYPNISSAADEKVISGASLPAYVRNLALNECIFSHMWNAMRDGQAWSSSWQSRLVALRRMGERFGREEEG